VNSVAASSTPSGLGASGDLGLGDLLGQQVAGETEEERKKRLAAMSQQGKAAGSPAAMQLLGGLGGPAY
jgi:hypothetical protein